MIEAYSLNITGNAGSAVPFNNVSIEKGCTAKFSSPATIQLNKCGVYAVSVDAVVTPTTAGTASIQLSKNGILQPQAQASVTAANTTDLNSLSFSTLVQVTDNNTCSCCSAPTLLQVINGTAATFKNINICVTKIC